MQKDTITAVVTVLLAIVGVAILAELVSNQSQTGKVLQAGGGAFSQMLCTALSPLGIGPCGGSKEVVTSTWKTI